MARRRGRDRVRTGTLLHRIPVALARRALGGAVGTAAPARLMRIAHVAPPWLAVPPAGYGGIEWIVALLADGLTDAGHEVTLFASGDSVTKATLSPVVPTAP